VLMMGGIILALVSGAQVLAGAQNAAQPPSSPPPAARASEPEPTTSGHVTPEKGELPPHPAVTPEAGQRLRRRTEREEPHAGDKHPPSPPGLPLVPGPEATVTPSPKDSSPPAR
jgi:hypothetical protein